MFHYYNALTNTRGDSLPGYFVRAVNTSDNSAATIYSDNSSTPISVVSGVVNMALTDSDGNVSFYIASGTYHVDIYQGDQTTFIKRIPAVPMVLANVADALGTDTATAPSQRAVNDALASKANTGDLDLKIDKTTLLANSNKLLRFGNLYGNGYDGVSDAQSMFGQTQPTFLASGSLGAVYGQRIVTHTGGATSYAVAPVSGAVRGYNQIASTVGITVECGGLFVTDNKSNVTQGVGVGGTTFSWLGGASWGGVFEVKEEPYIFTATAGQTVFALTGGFNAIAAVTKNGTLLTAGSQYTTSSPNVTLASGAAAGDTIKVYPGNPANGMLGAEIDVSAGAGTDTANAQAGNRQGLGIVARRADRSINVTTRVGTLLNLYASPDDSTYFVADRGINFQGQFDRGIDFASSDAVYSSYLIKFNSTGAGLVTANHLALGNQGTNALGGYASLYLANNTNGGIIRLGDGTHFGRIEANTATGVTFGSETNTDTILKRNGGEVARLTANTGVKGVGITLAAAALSSSYANDAAAAAGGVPVGGIYRNGSALQVRVA